MLKQYSMKSKCSAKCFVSCLLLIYLLLKRIPKWTCKCANSTIFFQFVHLMHGKKKEPLLVYQINSGKINRYPWRREGSFHSIETNMLDYDIIVSKFKLQLGYNIYFQNKTLRKGMVGWVLWNINHCRLFNAKSSLYIYIKYMICKHILFITFLNFSCSQMVSSIFI